MNPNNPPTIRVPYNILWDSDGRLDPPVVVVPRGPGGYREYRSSTGHCLADWPKDDPVEEAKRLQEVFLELVGGDMLPVEAVLRAFAVIPAWREMKVGGWVAFLPGRYERFNFHNPD